MWRKIKFPSMYIAAIVLLMLVLPLISVAAQTSMLPDAAALMAWSASGSRLGRGGSAVLGRAKPGVPPAFHCRGRVRHRRSRRPRPGARNRLRQSGDGHARDLEPVLSGMLLPAAIVGGLFFGLAGLGHLVRKNRSLKEQVALVSDLAIFALLAAFVASRVVSFPRKRESSNPCGKK